MDKALYEEFKRQLLYDRDRAVENIEANYKRHLEDLEALWSRVQSNGHAPSSAKAHPSTHETAGNSRKKDSDRVNDIVRSIHMHQQVSQPIIADLWESRYPKRAVPSRTLVSRVLRRWQELGVLHVVAGDVLGQVKVYVKTGNIN